MFHELLLDMRLSLEVNERDEDSTLEEIENFRDLGDDDHSGK